MVKSHLPPKKWSISPKTKIGHLEWRSEVIQIQIELNLEQKC